MAVNLTETNKLLAQQISINPQSYLEIEGLDTIIGAQPVFEFTKWDDDTIYWDDGSKWDGLSEKADSKAVISLDESTKNITQQIFPDKGGSSSLPSVNIALVDLNNEIAQLLSFNNLGEILGRKADYYIGFAQGAFPEDAIPVYRGVISDFYTQNGIVMVTVSHPENLKRQTIFQTYVSETTSGARYGYIDLQDLSYQQVNTSTLYSIEYLSGGAFQATFNSNTISVSGMSGKTASQIQELVENTAGTGNRVNVIVIGSEGAVQAPVSVTPFIIDTEINVVSTLDIIENRDTATTLFRVGDEVMQLVSIDSGVQITVIRAVNDTFGASHDDESEIVSIQQISGEPLDLALKIMLSDEDNSYFDSFDIPSTTNFVDITETIDNAFIFDYYNMELRTGLVVGDSILISTGVNAGTYTIAAFGILNDGSYIQVAETLITENPFVGDFQYRSQYNVLPDGCGMLSNNVDIASHLLIKSQFPSTFVEYTFQLKETIDNAKEFLDQQVYFPQGLYTINRSARSSVKIVTPPFTSDIVPTIDVSNIVNISDLRQRRSLHKYLYNIIRYDYDPDILEDKFLTKDIILSNDSLNRIKGGKKQMKIEARGLKRSAATTLMLNQVTQRVIDRYKFAPTYFEGVHVKYSDGFSLEVGDVLPFGGLDSKVINLNTGLRGTEEQLYEVINISLNNESGDIKLDLLSTSFSIRTRNAVVSLTSGISDISTSTNIRLETIIDTGEFTGEVEKWLPFEGQNVRVYKDDYTDDETVLFKFFDPSDLNVMIVEPALTFTPTSDHFVEIPEYNNTNSEIDNTYKIQFAHWDARTSVSVVIDAISFEVNDPTKLAENSEIYVHSPDYTTDSFDDEAVYTIASIVGSVVTLDTALTFIPQVGDFVEFSDFLDGGYPYGII